MKIQKHTKILDALHESKNIQRVLDKYNLDCAGCKGAVEDTIEKIALNNGLELDAFLQELNKALEQ